MDRIRGRLSHERDASVCIQDRSGYFFFETYTFFAYYNNNSYHLCPETAWLPPPCFSEVEGAVPSSEQSCRPPDEKQPPHAHPSPTPVLGHSALAGNSLFHRWIFPICLQSAHPPLDRARPAAGSQEITLRWASETLAVNLPP